MRIRDGWWSLTQKCGRHRPASSVSIETSAYLLAAKVPGHRWARLIPRRHAVVFLHGNRSLICAGHHHGGRRDGHERILPRQCKGRSLQCLWRCCLVGSIHCPVAGTDQHSTDLIISHRCLTMSSQPSNSRWCLLSSRPSLGATLARSAL